MAILSQVFTPRCMLWYTGEKDRVRGSTVALPWELALLRPTIRGARPVHGTGASVSTLGYWGSWGINGRFR